VTIGSLKSLDRPLVWGLCFAAGFAIVAASFLTDGTYDLENYHFYNGFAAFHDRTGLDIVPAQLQTTLFHGLDAIYYVVFASLNDEGIVVVTNQHTGTSNYRTLDELQERLDPGVFWRVHRSHLVNINKIKEIVPWFSRNYILRMKDQKSTEIPVSRMQTRRLREYLKL